MYILAIIGEQRMAIITHRISRGVIEAASENQRM